jgi:hypothetical protein
VLAYAEWYCHHGHMSWPSLPGVNSCVCNHVYTQGGNLQQQQQQFAVCIGQTLASCSLAPSVFQGSLPLRITLLVPLTSRGSIAALRLLCICSVRLYMSVGLLLHQEGEDRTGLVTLSKKNPSPAG